ncbi:hypothetical protein Tco_0282312, partial [Tanacetum coccineum]
CMSKEAWAVMGMKRSTDPSKKTLMNSKAAAKHQHEEYKEGKVTYNDDEEIIHITRTIAKFTGEYAGLVPSCCVIFDLEPLSLYFDFVFTSEILKSLSFSLDSLCHLVFLCHDQHAHTLHLLESSLIISLDRLVILKYVFEHEHVVMNRTSAGMWHLHLHLYMNPKIKQLAIKRVDEYGFIQIISLTGFPAQSVGSSNTDVLDLPCLLVLITGTSQSRQHGNSESDSYHLSD